MAVLAFSAEHRAATPLLLAARCRRCRSMSSARPALSSKPAARRDCGRKMGQTDRRRDARPFHRSCCERRQQTVGQRKRRNIMLSPRVRLSVRLSQAGIVSKRPDDSSWFLAWRLPSTYPALCYKEIWVSPKIRVLSSGTLSQTPD